MWNVWTGDQCVHSDSHQGGSRLDQVNGFSRICEQGLLAGTGLSMESDAHGVLWPVKVPCSWCLRGGLASRRPLLREALRKKAPSSVSFNTVMELSVVGRKSWRSFSEDYSGKSEVYVF